MKTSVSQEILFNNMRQSLVLLKCEFDLMTDVMTVTMVSSEIIKREVEYLCQFSEFHTHLSQP